MMRRFQLPPQIVRLVLLTIAIVGSYLVARYWIHRIYSAEEDFAVLSHLATEKLFFTLNIGQALLGTLVPLVLLGSIQSKSMRGFMSYKMELAGMEGWLVGLAVLALPFVILIVMIKLFHSERLPTAGHTPHPTA